MADVTGIPVPTGASPFDVPGDLRAFADHVGGLSMFSVATASSLPSSGNWEGRLLMARDSGVLYRCTSLPATWRSVTDVSGTISPAAGFTLQSASFLKKDSAGFVTGLLLVSRGSAIAHDTQIATLPSGFRPPVDLTMRDTSGIPGTGNGSADYVVSTAGTVRIYTPFAGSTQALLRLQFKV